MPAILGDGRSTPTHISLEASVMRGLPRVSWSLNSEGAATSGAGNSDEAVNKCLGEFYERRHFYYEVTSDIKSPLSEALTNPEELTAFYALFAQTGRERDITCISKHCFHMSRVFRINDFKECFIPTVLVSLSNFGLEGDADFMPLRDTTGCSAHFDFDTALYGSIKELMERQYLLRHWLLGGNGVRLTVAPTALAKDAQFLAEHLNSTGKLILADLSPEAPGSSIIAIYRGTEEAAVRYCVGMAYDQNPISAATKAIRELWQSYNFLYAMECGGANAQRLIHDRYHKYFLSCNTIEIADMMSEGLSDCVGLKTSCEKAELMSAAVNALGAVYVYARPEYVADRQIWCVKTVSPGAFFHIDNSAHFNLNNTFSKDFIPRIDPLRRARMVPFP